MSDPDLAVRVTLLICKCKKYHYAQLNSRREDAAMLSNSKVESSSRRISRTSMPDVIVTLIIDIFFLFVKHAHRLINRNPSNLKVSIYDNP